MTTVPLTITLYISSFNQSSYLGESIESALAQTRPPDQLIIIDDCSTDGSRDVIDTYHRRHPALIEPIYNQRNIGIGAVRALAIERARGELVTYLDGDDLYEPRKLELEERALIEHPGAGYAYSNFTSIDHDGEHLKTWSDGGGGALLPSGDLFDTLASFTMPGGVCHRCELVRTQIVRRVGSYEPGLNLYEDFDLALRYARHHRAVAVGEPTHRYRLHDAGLHRTSYATHFDALQRVYARNAGLIDSLPPQRRASVREGMNAVLSRYAWRAIKQCAIGEIELKPSQVMRYAHAGATLSPRSMLMLKHPYRVARALTGL